jgi:hypothetical protein
MMNLVLIVSLEGRILYTNTQTMSMQRIFLFHGKFRKNNFPLKQG